LETYCEKCNCIIKPYHDAVQAEGPNEMSYFHADCWDEWEEDALSVVGLEKVEYQEIGRKKLYELE